MRRVCPPGQQSGGGRGNRVAAPEGHHITVFLHRLLAISFALRLRMRGRGGEETHAGCVG